jgi:acetamidase/formamidase
MATHELPLERRTLHGHFSRDLEPVLIVEPGDSVVFSTLQSGWVIDGQGPLPRYFEPRDPELDAGHALCGPVEVRGARAGQTLAVRIDEVRPGDWGVTLADEEPLLWTIDSEAGTATAPSHGWTVALAPFLGVLGMPPPEPGVHSTIPPRRFGGNIDCKELLPGATLYLPIPVDGALFSAGDGHGAQGDGEVSGTAIECPLERAQVTLGLRDDMDLRMPVARTAAAWLAFGFDEDLDTAAELALATMLDLMEGELGCDRRDALKLASVAVDLRITQIVNVAKGVHAVLPHDALVSTGVAR